MVSTSRCGHYAPYRGALTTLARTRAGTPLTDAAEELLAYRSTVGELAQPERLPTPHRPTWALNSYPTCWDLTVAGGPVRRPDRLRDESTSIQPAHSLM